MMCGDSIFFYLWYLFLGGLPWWLLGKYEKAHTCSDRDVDGGVRHLGLPSRCYRQLRRREQSSKRPARPARPVRHGADAHVGQQHLCATLPRQVLQAADSVSLGSAGARDVPLGGQSPVPGGRLPVRRNISRWPRAELLRPTLLLAKLASLFFQAPGS